MKWEHLKLEWRHYTFIGAPEWCIKDRSWPDLVEALNDLGAEGWECAAMLSRPSAEVWLGPVEQCVILKREVEG